MIDIIKTLENIKDFCATKKACEECQFYDFENKDYKDCKITQLFVELTHLPYNWDIKKIKEILDE